MRWIAIVALAAAVCSLPFLWRGLSAQQKFSTDTNESPASLKPVLEELRLRTEAIQKDLRRLVDRRYEYRVETVNRLKTRNAAELINSMAQEGWEYQTEMQNEGHLFRRPVEAAGDGIRGKGK